MACTRGLGFHKKWIHVIHVVVSVNPLIVCFGLAWLAYRDDHGTQVCVPLWDANHWFLTLFSLKSSASLLTAISLATHPSVSRVNWNQIFQKVGQKTKKSKQTNRKIKKLELSQKSVIWVICFPDLSTWRRGGPPLEGIDALLQLDIQWGRGTRGTGTTHRHRWCTGTTCWCRTWCPCRYRHGALKSKTRIVWSSFHLFVFGSGIPNWSCFFQLLKLQLWQSIIQLAKPLLAALEDWEWRHIQMARQC